MSYREYIPSMPFRPFVDCYWHHITSNAVPGKELPVQRCLPLGTVEIIVQVDGVLAEIFDNQSQVWERSARIYITGLYTDTALWRAKPGTLMFGIRLKPETLIELFQIPASEVINKVIDAEALLGQSARNLCDQMLGELDVCKLTKIAEQFMLGRLRSRELKRNYVTDACRLIRDSNGDLSVEQVSDAVFISKRQLERMFKSEFGTSPKTYQRIVRFRNAYRYARKYGHSKIHWADVSYESGYADQAHFIRDFKAFTGIAPSVIVTQRESFFQTLESVTH